MSEVHKTQPHPLPPRGLETPHTLAWQRLAHYAAYTAFIASGFLPGLAGYFEKHLFPAWQNYVLFSAYATQAGIILILGAIAALQTPKTHDRFKRASLAVEQFVQPWVMLWMVWFALYVIFSAQEFLKASAGPTNSAGVSPYWDLASNMLNNLQTVFVLLCYIYLSLPTNPGSKDNLKPLLLALWFLITFVNWLYVLAFHPKPDEVGLMFFRSLSGLAAGATLALFVGQIGSRYLDPPRTVLAALYLYAVLQLSYEEFVGPSHRYIQQIATTLALPLKLLLFGVVYSFLKKGRMLYYMERARQLYDSSPDDWRAFETVIQEPIPNADATSAS